MSVDWNVFHSALQQSRDGHNLKALAVLSALMHDAETDSDRAAIVLGEQDRKSQVCEGSRCGRNKLDTDWLLQGDQLGDCTHGGNV